MADKVGVPIRAYKAGGKGLCLLFGGGGLNPNIKGLGPEEADDGAYIRPCLVNIYLSGLAGWLAGWSWLASWVALLAPIYICA